MRIVRTTEELDQAIRECDKAEAISDDAMRAMFGTFAMEPKTPLPADPFSLEYRVAQLRLYEEIAGKPYSTANEVTSFDVAAAVRNPFPFHTKSSLTAGEYFMAIGFVLKTMALPPNSRVLEFGAGWGFTSLWLAQLGHHVTVVDIEPCFCELISERAKQACVDIEVINSDFFWLETSGRTFDAVLFYDCFHHCDDHIRLLHGLKNTIERDGRVFFGAEPIRPDFSMPWGLRLDGWSLWGIRKNGWMELGFRDDYFSSALARAGFFSRKIAVEGLDRLRVWEARHLWAAVFRFSGDDANIHTQVGLRRDGSIVFDGASAGTALFGPYIDLPPGRFRARIYFRPEAGPQGKSVLDVVCNQGETRLAILKEPRNIGSRPYVELYFESASDIRGLEVRLFAEKGFSAAFERLEIAAVPES